MYTGYDWLSVGTFITFHSFPCHCHHSRLLWDSRLIFFPFRDWINMAKLKQLSRLLYFCDATEQAFAHRRCHTMATCIAYRWWHIHAHSGRTANMYAIRLAVLWVSARLSLPSPIHNCLQVFNLFTHALTFIRARAHRYFLFRRAHLIYVHVTAFRISRTFVLCRAHMSTLSRRLFGISVSPLCFPL